MFKIFALLIIGINSVCSPLYAGWTSSGGDIIEDKNNPWFFTKNGTVPANIYYCIDMDTEYFSSTPEKAKDLIERAKIYWQNELKEDNQIFVLAKESFVLTSCSDKRVQLKFLFGSLRSMGADEQKAIEYVNPRERVALAVRTEYDPINLSGKGFIYFSADSGPLAMSDSNLIDRPWSYDQIFFAIIIHELGHVYGVKHLGNGLMAAEAPNMIIEDGSFTHFFTEMATVQTILSMPSLRFRNYREDVCIDLLMITQVLQSLKNSS